MRSISYNQNIARKCYTLVGAIIGCEVVYGDVTGQAYDFGRTWLKTPEDYPIRFSIKERCQSGRFTRYLRLDENGKYGVRKFALVKLERDGSFDGLEFQTKLSGFMEKIKK